MTADLTLTYGSLNLTDSPFGVQFGMDVGAPQNVTEALAFLLQDGEVELTDRTSNRTITFTVLVEGGNLTVLAEAEALLVAESDKPLNTLTVDPGDGAPATVYETYRGQVVLLRDDEYERNGYRAFQVTVRALPFGRSAIEVVAPALAASGSTTTSVDTGSATTGWAGDVNGSPSTVSVSSGAVGTTSATVAGSVTVGLTRVGAITTSATKYLMIDWRGVANFPLKAYSSGVELERISQASSPTAGYTRSWFYVPGSSVSTLLLTQSSLSIPTPTSRPLFIDAISRTDVRPTFGSARQQLRSIDVSGSVRTPGRLTLESETSALNDAIVYVWSGGAEGYAPPLRQFRTSGGVVTTDATKVSGAYEPVKSTTITYDIPVSRLTPGSYLLMCRLFSTTGAASTTTMTVTTQTVRVGGSSLGSAESRTVTVNDANSTSGVLKALGRYMLPSVEVNPDGGARVLLTLNATTTAPDLSIDEAWLFHEDGHLTIVYAGAENRLYIDPPTSYTPRPKISVGDNADRSDAHAPGSIGAWQFPQFVPPRVSLFTVTTGALDTNGALAYYPSWHSNAAT